MWGEKLSKLSALIGILMIFLATQTGCDTAGGSDESSDATVISKYIHTARSGTFVPSEGSSDIFKLTMEKVPFEIVSVYERPKNLERMVPFNAFVTGISEDFLDGPLPQLGLEYPRGEESIVSIFEILNVSYDVENALAVYVLRTIEPGEESESLMEFFNQAEDFELATTVDESFKTPTIHVDGIDHGKHYQPHESDKLGNGATAILESPAHIGVIKLKNDSGKNMDLEVETSQDNNVWKLTFTMENGAEVCATYTGLGSIKFKGDGFITVAEDKSVHCTDTHKFWGWGKDKCPSDCTNKFNLQGGKDWDKEGLEAADGIANVVGAFT